MPLPAFLVPALVGAGLGAATSEDPLKGALIGGAAGGLTGGLLGPSGGAAGEITSEGVKAGLPSLSSELAGTAGGVVDLGAAIPGTAAETASKGFKEKVAVGLLSNAGSFLPQRQPTPQAPAGSLPRTQFQPSGNLFLQLRRRRA